jgi:hypothetical protein
MKIRTLALSLVAAGFLAGHAAAQPVDCACASDYSVGDRVVALVSNPGGATALPAGAMGTVVCGTASFPGQFDVLVRWDGWADGEITNVQFCECPASPGGGTDADWFVTCSEIELFTPVTNITQGTDHPTIADGVASANSGDVLELDAHTFVERGIVLNNKDITIRGQGPDLTIVDGDNVVGKIFEFRNGDESTIEGLTMRNGVADTANGGGAVFLSGLTTSVVFRDCNFKSNDSNGFLYGAIYVESAAVIFEHCVFSGSSSNRSASHIGALSGASVTAIQCLFAGDADAQNAITLLDSGSPVSGLFVNCTFADFTGQRHIRIVGAGSTGEIIGCIFDDSPSTNAFGATNGATILTNSRNVYANATGDNIDGVPTFVDAPNGDYRLAAGSLGIDAANYDTFAANGGGLIDLAGAFRLQDDPGVFNTGIGATTQLDCGAYEFQGNSPSQAQCPGDLDSDGDTDLGDFTILASDFGCIPAP